ncbi:MAG TPA: ABC transporter permease, partial [Burkholderiales bacterium]|nr:ABC transporter permease [Burkholderiales bacterium]
MISYLVRRILYAIPILIGVNMLTFLLFFVVNSPDDMARMQLGQKRVSDEAVLKWKQERGYDKPRFFNAGANGTGKLTNTIFFEKSVPLFWFNFD